MKFSVLRCAATFATALSLITTATAANAEIRLKYSQALSMPFVATDTLDDTKAATIFADLAKFQALGTDGDRRAFVQLLFSSSQPHALWFGAAFAKDLTQRGIYSEALSAWETVWQHGQALDLDGQQLSRAYVGRIGVNLAELYARLGRTRTLQKHLKDLGPWPLRGGLTERLTRAREGYLSMKTHPERSFNCGPYALGRALRVISPDSPAIAAIEKTKGAGENGFSLAQLAELCRTNNIDFTLAECADPKHWEFPAVIHLRSGHYALAESRQGDSILVHDTTFKRRELVAIADLKREASGFLLVPKRINSPRWKPVTSERATSIRGKGAPEKKETEDSKEDECEPCKPGMPSVGRNLYETSAVITDTPLPIETPYGPSLTFSMRYWDAAKALDINTPMSKLGLKWSHGFFSYIEPHPTFFQNHLIYLPGGRSELHVPQHSIGRRWFADPPGNGSATFGYTGFHPISQTKLFAVPGGFKRVAKDGSYLLYDYTASAGARRYLSEIVDAQGTKVTLHYEPVPNLSGDRLVRIEDSFGRSIHFEHNETDPFLISRVVEKFGNAEKRAASFFYNAAGDLSQVTDAVGISASFNYYSATDLSGIRSLVTPYGTTSFDRGTFSIERDDPDSNILGQTITYHFEHLKITDPEGLKEHLLYAPVLEIEDFSELNAAHPIFGGSSSSVEDHSAGRIELAFEGVTLFWDKKASKYHNPDFLTGKNFEFARATLWMLGDTPDDPRFRVRPFVTATRSPMTSWVSYSHPGGDSGDSLPAGDDGYQPTKISRTVLDYDHTSGTSSSAVETTELTYDSSGNLTSQKDPTTDITARFTYHSLNRLRSISFEGRQHDTPLDFESNGQPIYRVTNQVLEVEYPSGTSQLPSAIYDASNGKTEFLYNSAGQVTRITNALGEKTHFFYGWPAGFTDPTPGETDGFLTSIERAPANGSRVPVVTYTYHPDTGYLASITDPQTGLTTQFPSYDALGRLESVIHSDATTESFSYVRDGQQIIELVTHTNREGLTSTYDYNGNRQLVAMRDPEQRLTQLKWCSCGHLEDLIDSMGRRTTWKRDLLGRVTEKIMPDGKKTTFTYEAFSGRLATRTSPNDQGTPEPTLRYHYFANGQLALIDFPSQTGKFFAKYFRIPNATGVHDEFNRIAQAAWQDESGTEQRDSFRYSPFLDALGELEPIAPGAGQLTQRDGPWANDTVSMAYDILGRQISTTIGSDPGTINLTSSWQQTLTSIDFLGRLLASNNGLGSRSYGYVGNESRLDTTTLTPLSGLPLTTSYRYLPSAEGGYLSQIQHLSGGNTLSQFDYGYDSMGRIASWHKQQGSQLNRHHSYLYDQVGQLRQAIERNGGPTGAVTDLLTYAYDAAGNRTAKTGSGIPRTAAFNDRNQIEAGQHHGPIPIIGSLDEPARVTVTSGGISKPAAMRPSGDSYLFESEVYLAETGNTQFTITATDQSENTTGQSYQMTGQPGQWISATYDDNGNTTQKITTDDGISETTDYTWDALDRLETVTRAGKTTRFVYNAFNERVKIIEQAGTAAESERRFIWTGSNHPSQERRGDNTVATSFYADGEIRTTPAGANTIYFYTKDHLGSIRQVIRATDGQEVANYDYSPFGIRKKLHPGPFTTEWGFTGHFHHEDSDTILTKYRAYDPHLGRWLSPDPLGEGVNAMGNLYNYVGNNPVNAWDPLGLEIIYLDDESRQAVANLRKIDPRLNKMISDLEGPNAQGIDHKHYIQASVTQASVNQGGPGGTCSTHGGTKGAPSSPGGYAESMAGGPGNGTIISFMLGTHTANPRPYLRNSYTVLAHELQHAWDHHNASVSMTPLSPLGAGDTAKYYRASDEHEFRAVRTGNIVREYYQRKHGCNKSIRKEYSGIPVPNPQGANSPQN